MCTEGGLIQVMTLLKEQSVITFSIMFSILGELKEIFSWVLSIVNFDNEAYTTKILNFLVGVTSLRVLLAREKDDVAPKLNILLCESMTAVYVSLLVNALAAYDCHMLYRLVAHRFHVQSSGSGIPS